MSEYGAAIDRVIEDFGVLDDWEDKYRYVIDLGRDLTPLSDSERSDANKVRGCASQVWLVASRDDGRFAFRGDSDALIVKGLVAIILKLYSGATPDEILARDARKVFGLLGLGEHLSQQRSNGFFSMVERIRALAAGG